MKNLLVVITLIFSFLPALAADPPDKGKSKSKSNLIFAKLKSGDQKWELVPNGLGNFPVVITKTNTPVEIEMVYPSAQAEKLAVVTIRDDGWLTSAGNSGNGNGNPGTPSSILRDRVGNNGRLRFTFHYSKSEHGQHVTIKVGSVFHSFEFHVGH